MRWSLSELEDIVFDFINAHDLPPEFKVPIPGSLDRPENDLKNPGAGKALKTPTKTVRIAEDPEFGQRMKRDVDREDLMNVKRGGKEENLPQMVREYILHDRGNSLFLGDSFGNLPSPVGESPSIKKLFKFNEDDPIENKKRKNESKNQAIRIEGKKEKAEDKVKSSPDKDQGKGLNVDLQEIDAIVFAETVKGPLKQNPVQSASNSAQVNRNNAYLHQ